MTRRTKHVNAWTKSRARLLVGGYAGLVGGFRGRPRELLLPLMHFRFNHSKPRPVVVELDVRMIGQYRHRHGRVG